MLKDTDHSHKPEAIAARLDAGPKPSFVREWIYGAVDGVVTTFAIVAGVVGANLSPVIVVILGIANLVGDGFSMAASAYSAARTDEDNLERLTKAEQGHIRKNPEGEREEIRQIYARKGFEGKDLEMVVETITKNEEVWVETMLHEEYGVSVERKSPFAVGFHTFFGFVICGAVPLLPYVLGMPHAFTMACTLSAVTFFIIGSIKSLWAPHPWWRDGLETFIIGMAAAGLAYGIGYGLKQFGL